MGQLVWFYPTSISLALCIELSNHIKTQNCPCFKFFKLSIDRLEYRCKNSGKQSNSHLDTYVFLFLTDKIKSNLNNLKSINLLYNNDNSFFSLQELFKCCSFE